MRRRIPTMTVRTVKAERIAMITAGCARSDDAGAGCDVLRRTSTFDSVAARVSGSTADVFERAMTAMAHGLFTSPLRATSVTTFAGQQDLPHQ